MGDRKKRRARGKGEGLNPSSKGSPGTRRRLSTVCKAQKCWAIVVSPQPAGPRRAVQPGHLGASSTQAWKRQWCSPRCLWWTDRRTSRSRGWGAAIEDSPAVLPGWAWASCCYCCWLVWLCKAGFCCSCIGALGRWSPPRR